jgi:hypothetical protein
VGRAVGKLATKVCKYNKRGIDVHFLNQHSRASVSLKVSEITPGLPIPISADFKPAVARRPSQKPGSCSKRQLCIMGSQSGLGCVISLISMYKSPATGTTGGENGTSWSSRTVCRVSLYAVRRRPVAHTLSADDLESVLISIAKKLSELGRPKFQVFGLHLKLQPRDTKLMRPGGIVEDSFYPGRRRLDRHSVPSAVGTRYICEAQHYGMISYSHHVVVC